MPQIAHFQVEKIKKLATVGGGTLPPFAPSQRLCPPNVLAHYATDNDNVSGAANIIPVSLSAPMPCDAPDI